MAANDTPGGKWNLEWTFSGVSTTTGTTHYMGVDSTEDRTVFVVSHIDEEGRLVIDDMINSYTGTTDTSMDYTLIIPIPVRPGLLHRIMSGLFNWFTGA